MTTKIEDMTPEQIQAAVDIAELALLHRDELESHKINLEARAWGYQRSHHMHQLIDAITTYERRKHL